MVFPHLVHSNFAVLGSKINSSLHSEQYCTCSNLLSFVILPYIDNISQSGARFLPFVSMVHWRWIICTLCFSRSLCLACSSFWSITVYSYSCIEVSSKYKFL